MSSIAIQDLHVSIADKEILRGVSLEFSKGEVHAVMGPNGSGKSTLAKVMAGHPDYQVTGGDILMDGVSILEMEPDERSREGLFMAFQYPMEIPGVSNANFLRAALQARLPEGEELEATEFYQQLYAENGSAGNSAGSSRRARSMKGSRVARRSGMRSCSWQYWSPLLPCLTRPTAAWISTL